MNAKQVPVGVSARHIHLTEEHIAHLFGDGHELKVLKKLLQPGLFAAEETVTLVGPKGEIGNVRVIGPARRATQVEISLTDTRLLGVYPPVRLSGRHDGTPGLTVRGPAGEIALERGVIIAARHLHLHTSEARAWGIADRQLLRVRIGKERPVVLEDVVARVSDRFALELHIDTDEANAAGVKTGDIGHIVET
jgi:putative phosphotransacetylase